MADRITTAVHATEPATDSGAYLGPAFAFYVEERGPEEAWDLLEAVARDGTDEAAATYNMDTAGCWLWGTTGPQERVFFAYA